MNTYFGDSMKNTHPTVFAIEGLDRLGKSSLIQRIKNHLGFYQVIHFSKPEILDVYFSTMFPEGSDGYVRTKRDAQYFYQRHSFDESMILAKSGAKLIFDRWHLGECVYAGAYRKYDGEYVFDLEKNHELDKADHIRLILLTEDFDISAHFNDDGLSLGSSSRENRKVEQGLFIEAFNKSSILDKRIICVTDPKTGKFKTKEQILEEVIS